MFTGWYCYSTRTVPDITSRTLILHSSQVPSTNR